MTAVLAAAGRLGAYAALVAGLALTGLVLADSIGITPPVPSAGVWTLGWVAWMWTKTPGRRPLTRYELIYRALLITIGVGAVFVGYQAAVLWGPWPVILACTHAVALLVGLVWVPEIAGTLWHRLVTHDLRRALYITALEDEVARWRGWYSTARAAQLRAEAAARREVLR